MRFLTVFCLIAASLACLALPALAQDATVLIDFGADNFPSSGVGPEAWNNLSGASINTALGLVDTDGLATGFTWAPTSAGFSSVNSAGTTTPAPGSALAGFPVSATQDVAYGSSGATTVVSWTGFAPHSMVDFTFAASRINVTDMRTTDYLVQGFNSGVGTLDPSNNVSDVATVSGILADASGKITVSVRAAPENSNAMTHYYYLGAVKAEVSVLPSPPAVLAFDRPQLSVALTQGKGGYVAPVGLLESLGASPTVSLSAVDEATGLSPTWLSVPVLGDVGAPVNLGFAETGLAVGDYSATLTASAAGYADTALDVLFEVRPEGVLNLLFYGNSYSQGNSGMPSLAGFIAEEFGHPAPEVVAKLAGGQDLFFHLTDPGQAAAITQGLPAGQTWDYVVMQGHSMEATQLGDPAAFRANALAILDNVKAHSSEAQAVLFQTWARAPGASVYPSVWAGPLGMHDEIRTNYRLAVGDMNAAYGPETAWLAAAGDSVALRGFDLSLYTADFSHPTAPTTLLTAMTVHQSIWRERICDMDPDFNGTTNLVDRLGNIGLGQADWTALSGIAERVADAELRRHPGSGEDVLLETSVNAAPPNARPQNVVVAGDTFHVQLSTPNALYAEDVAHLVFDAFVTGAPPPAFPGFPEVHVQSSFFIVTSAAHLASGLAFDIDIPPVASGLSILVQGFALGASAETGNPFFSTSDGHELELP
jgi:hypothetical protein